MQWERAYWYRRPHKEVNGLVSDAKSSERTGVDAPSDRMNDASRQIFDAPRQAGGSLATAPTALRPAVTSELGRLRQVIVHRPGRELARLTPSNKDDLLFDDVLWLERAEEEHDAFSAALREQGVVVHHFERLLRETLAIEGARQFVLTAAFDEHLYGPALATALRDHLAGADPDDLYDVLVGGLTKSECLERMPVPESVAFGITRRRDFLITPLTNHLFTRDASCWIGPGVSENSMMHAVRRREAVNYQAIHRWHPLFAGVGFPLWSNGLESGLATMEGGDVLVVAPDALVVGLSERTTPQAVERLAARLFEAGAISRVVAIRVPRARAFMHLDTVLTMADVDTFMKYAGLGEPDCFLIEPAARPVSGRPPLAISALTDGLDAALARALGTRSVRVLTTAQDSYAAERDQWNDGCNLLAVRPGVVLAYERNTTSIAYLRDNGIEVVPVPGSELGRGRGGPRCMSCPIVRDDL